MGITRKKAVFLDIDGTLILDSPFPFEEDLEVMKEAAGKGHSLFLNTGRSFANIPPALLGLPAIRGIAAGGGAHILLGSSPESPAAVGREYHTIFRRSIPEDFLGEVISLYAKNSIGCFLEGERDCYIINRSSRLFTVRDSIPVNSFEDFKKKKGDDFITKLTIDGFVSGEERHLLESFVKLNGFSHYTEGIIKGENKAKAMELVLERLGLKREDSIAIGDGVNDLDMIRFAGLGIAMGNAAAELKAAAGAVTGDCGEGGIAGALRKFVL